MPYFPTGYYPAGYFPPGYFPDSASVPQPPANAQRELDVRLYDSTGKRLRLPAAWVNTVEFEISERGGYQNGTLQILVPWEQLQLTGKEYADIWLWGQRVYRGYVLQPQNELGVPERSSPTLYGLMEKLNGYQVRRCYCYAQMVDISQVFLDLANEFVVRIGRLPNLVLDATGVPAQNITLNDFCAKGKSFSQAMNQLCDLSPDTFIWGCDVDANGRDRLYFRPRATATKYRYTVGRDVQAFVYPRDVTQVVNIVHISGGKADPPNIAPNASFEDCVVPGESSTNLLQNPSFEDHDPSKGSGEFAQYWQRGYRASRKVFPDDSGTNYSRTGSCWMELDNYNDGAPEQIAQTVSIGFSQTVNCSVWARQQTPGDKQTFRIVLTLTDAIPPADTAPTVLAQYVSPDLTPGDQYTHFQVQWSPPLLANGTYMQALFTITSAAGQGHGILLDDASLWLGNVQAKSWRVGGSVNANFSQLDWQNHDTPNAVDGAIMVKEQANILVAGGYTELCTTVADRPQGEGGRIYYIAAHFQAIGGTAQVAVGLREYQNQNDATVLATHVSATTNIVTSLWQIVTLAITSNPNTGYLEPFLRFYNATAVYVDAVGLYEGVLPPLYYPSDTFEASRSVDDYASVLDTATANSRVDWGDREKEESQESIVDQATLDAYCPAYFRAHGTPAVQGRLTVKGATSPITVDGLVTLQNLASPAPPLFPTRIRYQIGESVDLDIDLNNERPDLAQLIRQAALQQIV